MFVTRHSISLLSFGGGGPGSFQPIKTVQAQGTQWTITDVQFTRDGRNFIYSSINPTLHLCNVSAGAEQHVAMRLGDGFGVWSMRISEDGTQVVAGTNYAVTLTAAPPNSTAAKAFDAVVFQPLPHTGQPLQLTSYTEK